MLEKDSVHKRLSVDGVPVRRMGNFILNFSTTAGREEYLLQFVSPRGLSEVVKIVEINELPAIGPPVSLFGVQDENDIVDGYVKNTLTLDDQVAILDREDYVILGKLNSLNYPGTSLTNR